MLMVVIVWENTESGVAYICFAALFGIWSSSPSSVTQPGIKCNISELRMEQMSAKQAFLLLLFRYLNMVNSRSICEEVHENIPPLDWYWINLTAFSSRCLIKKYSHVYFGPSSLIVRTRHPPTSLQFKCNQCSIIPLSEVYSFSKQKCKHFYFHLKILR